MPLSREVKQTADSAYRTFLAEAEEARLTRLAPQMPEGDAQWQPRGQEIAAAEAAREILSTLWSHEADLTDGQNRTTDEEAHDKIGGGWIGIVESRRPDLYDHPLD